MAGDSEIVRETFRWWYLPSWLGLDAPCVVTTWTWAISQSIDVPLPLHAAGAMFFTVWSIYLLDRMIDVARCKDWRQATGRLRFGRQYRPLFLACFSLCIVAMAAFLVAGIPTDVIVRAAFVALGFAAHFLVYVVPVFFRDKLPGKEVGVGVFFALGAYACLGYAPGVLPLLVAVAALVAFNCLVIAAKDAASDRANDPGGASQWWPTMQRDLMWGGVGLTIAFASAAIVGGERTFHISAAAAFLGLTVLHGCAQRLSGDAVRALADFALFTPLMVIGPFGNI